MRRIGKLLVLVGGIMNMLFYLLKSRAFRKRANEIWLISERGDDAQDSGYFFFKFLMEHHANDGIHYVIERQCPDYEFVKSYPNTVEHCSSEHKRLFVNADKIISTHAEYFFPWKQSYLKYRYYKRLFGRRQRFIFLDHGIIKDDLSSRLSKELIQADIFVTSTRRERDSIFDYDYGYEENEVILTGLPRYDSLKSVGSLEQILLMPTHRLYIARTCKGDDEFKETHYYKFWNDFINDVELTALLKSANARLIFYPHYGIQKYMHCFELEGQGNVVLASKGERSVQQLLKSSRLLITDYSSVFFDFAYMKKPTIYCQFDREEFLEGHYSEGYFDYERDGFGAVLDDAGEVVRKIRQYVENRYMIEEKYLARIDETFEFFDSNCCQRIYQHILNLN